MSRSTGLSASTTNWSMNLSLSTSKEASIYAEHCKQHANLVD